MHDQITNTTFFHFCLLSSPCSVSLSSGKHSPANSASSLPVHFHAVVAVAAMPALSQLPSATYYSHHFL